MKRRKESTDLATDSTEKAPAPPYSPKASLLNSDVCTNVLKINGKSVTTSPQEARKKVQF